MIEIWGKPMCPHCDQAKAFCEKSGFDYVYKQLGVDFEREQVFETFPGARTFPQIIVNGIKVGSKDQFLQYIEDTGYNGTGHIL
tara:strand:+ start:1566 stop:1817 length:252 start_codon:yes stop_codon:yes gene_type:complete